MKLPSIFWNYIGGQSISDYAACMPRHFETKILPYTPQQMFDLVADIERYPDFLPWCLGAHVYDVREDELKADLQVGAAPFQESFASIVTLQKPCAITVEYGGGSLAHLTNEWHFRAVEDGKACEVEFLVDFRLKSSLLGAMMELFFHKAFHKMVTAFEDRANHLYGGK